MAQCVEVTYIDIKEFKEAELCKDLQTVLCDTVETAVHIITSMMDMLSGNCTTHASMNVNK